VWSIPAAHVWPGRRTDDQEESTMWNRDSIQRAQPTNRSAAYYPDQIPPPTPHEVVRQHELRRRGRLVRIIALGLGAAVLLLIPAAFIPSPNVITFLALAVTLVGALGAHFLGRYNRVSAAGYMLLGGLALAVALEIVGKALKQGGLDLSDLRLYDLFALPIVLSGVIVNRRSPIVIASLTGAFSILSLVILHRTPALDAYWNATYPVPGSPYDVVSVAIVLQGLTATAAWLGADSVRRALLDASRAEDLARANERILAQAGEIQAQRQRLQDGIAHLQQVHAAVAHGRWDARAQIESGELLPVAVSLNLLLDRLSRLTQEHAQRARGDAAAHELAVALRRVWGGGPYIPPAFTGTPLDEVVAELARLRTILTQAAGSQPSVVPSDPAPQPGARSLPLTSPGAPPAEPSGPVNYLPPWLQGDRQ
jgi:hypothetical protein